MPLSSTIRPATVIWYAAAAAFATVAVAAITGAETIKPEEYCHFIVASFGLPVGLWIGVTSMATFCRANMMRMESTQNRVAIYPGRSCTATGTMLLALAVATGACHGHYWLLCGCAALATAATTALAVGGAQLWQPPR